MDTMKFKDLDSLFDYAVRYGAIEGLEYPKDPKRCIKYATEKALCNFNFNYWLTEIEKVELCDDTPYICNYESHLTDENFGKMLKWRYDEEKKDKLEAERHYNEVRRKLGIIEYENTPPTDNAISKSEPNTPKKEADNQPQYDKLRDFFVPAFKGMNGGVDFFTSMVNNLKTPRSGKEIAQIAFMAYGGGRLNRRKPNTFREWHRLFCDCLVLKHVTYDPNKLKKISENLKNLFNYLQQ